MDLMNDFIMMYELASVWALLLDNEAGFRCITTSNFSCTVLRLMIFLTRIMEWNQLGAIYHLFIL